MNKKYVYLFSEGNASMRELLGGKGANLAEMTKIGLPVPQGFTISTEACTQYYEDGKQINESIRAEIMENMKESVQNFTHDQKERVQEFSDTLGDSISYHMAQVGADIGEKMVHATATFDEKAQKLRQAYKQLVAYTNIHYTRYWLKETV